MYYHTKLKVHNFTVYDLQRRAGYCYIWNKTDDELTVIVFASIYCSFLAEYRTAILGNRTITLYVDG